MREENGGIIEKGELKDKKIGEREERRKGRGKGKKR